MICVGNICRSPTAEFLLKHALREQPVSVASAGIGALVGKGVDAQAEKLLSAAGIDASTHCSRQLSAEMLRDADLVLVMERGHVDAVCDIAPTARGKVFLLGHWSNGKEVPDPFRRSDEMFEQVYQTIDEMVGQWLPMIAG